MTSLAVLAVGEAMVELSPTGDAELWRLGFAGDTLNTAWYLRHLLPADQAVGYLTRIGQGGFSQRLRDFIGGAGIVTDHIGTDPVREVGLYAIELQDGERSFAYWRSASAARGLADDPAALRAFTQAGLIYLSGITAAILPPVGRDRLAAALADARAAGAQVAFDTNIRPRLWEDAATLRDQITRFAGLADLVLPSIDEESAQFGDASPQDCIARYLAAGARQVVVKNGGGPVHYGGAEGTGCVDDLPRVQPVDTTAAGDSFNAGYLAARLAGQGIPAAIRAGHAVACRVIAARGALVAV